MKHKDIVKAWLDGAEIEVRKKNTDKWEKRINYSDNRPYFVFDFEGFEYRIKPKTAVVKFKVFKANRTGFTRIVESKDYWAFDREDDWTCISEEQTVEIPIKT